MGTGTVIDPYEIYENYHSTETDQYLDNVTGNELFEELRPTGNKKFLTLLLLIPLIAGFLYGYDIGGTASCLTPGGYKGMNMMETFNMTTLQAELITSESLIGAVIGSIIVYWTGNYLSRRGVLMMAAGFYGGGALIASASTTIIILAIGRTFYGLGIGFSMHSMPLYVSEVSPAKFRGIFMALSECMVMLGIVMGYVQGILFLDVYEGWRYIYLSALLPALVLFIGMFFIYPSPRWLVLKALQNQRLDVRDEYLDQAHLSLSRIRRLPLDVVQFELNEIIDTLSSQQNDHFRFTDFFRDRSLSRALFIGCSLALFQQLTGQSALLYYTTTVFDALQLKVVMIMVASIMLGMIKFVVTIFSAIMIERMGRKVLLMLGIVVMLFSLAILSIFSFLIYYHDGSSLQSLRFFQLIDLIASFGFVSGYQIGFGPITWTMMSEIFPLKSRTQATSLMVLVNFGTCYLMVSSFLTILNQLTAGGTFSLFFCVTLISLLFVWFFVPETKGKTLEQIERHFRKLNLLN